MRLLALGLAVWLASGCSWIMVERAPKREVWDETPYSSCTTGKGPAVVDTVFSVLTGASMLFANAASVIFFVPWTISAYHGHTETTACEEYGMYRLSKKAKEPAAPTAAPPTETPKPAAPAAGVMEKAKKCQEKGGIWVNDSCQISIEDK